MVISSIDLKDGKVVQLKNGKDKVLERDNPLKLISDFNKYGEVAALMTVKEEEDIILISSEGIVIRMPADSISLF